MESDGRMIGRRIGRYIMVAILLFAFGYLVLWPMHQLYWLHLVDGASR